MPGSVGAEPVLNLGNWDAVVFDCDGVLLDSNHMKIAAFVRTLEDAGVAEPTRQAFSQFQRHNFGTSRHKLFTELLTGRFGPCPEGLDLAFLLDRFGAQCVQGYLESAITPGTLELLASLGDQPAFVASGSEQGELRQVFDQRGLSGYFRGVYGSPTPKSQLLASIRSSLSQSGQQHPPRLVMVGDARADFEAARSNQADFIFVAAYSTVRDTMLALAQQEGFAVVETLAELRGQLFHQADFS